MSRFDLPLSRPYLTGNERAYLEAALADGHLCGDGPFAARCERLIEAQTAAHRALLVHSGTAALEAAVLIAGLGPGDEAVMPSFTFSSTANAVALRGAVPVFVDIRADTLNLDERLIEAAITPRTRAIVPVHYAGVACAMEPIMAIARARGLTVIEDAAQGVGATWRGRALGTIGDMGALSYHVTKNVFSGEGGALLVAYEALAHQAEIVREKGTDRARLMRGEVSRYEWQGLGSSFIPGELVAAFLLAQLEQASAITAQRLAIWDKLHAALAPAEAEGLLRRPVVPADCAHNGHIYHVRLADAAARPEVTARLAAQRIQLLSHYEPLHAAPAGRRYGRVHGALDVTVEAAAQLLRLPLWVGMTDADATRIAQALTAACRAG